MRAVYPPVSPGPAESSHPEVFRGGVSSAVIRRHEMVTVDEFAVYAR